MEDVRKAIEVLKCGGVIGFPTDTVYGIGCDAYNQQAKQKIYNLKKRALIKPLILFIRSKSELNKYVSEIPEVGSRLIDKFWPGKLTIIFGAKSNSPVQSPNFTIGIRIPNYEPILTILKNYENPLATTSANIEGTPPPINNLEINITPDFIIPGECGSGIPSTIIDICGSTPHHEAKLLREGEITMSELVKVIGRSA